MDFFLVMGHRKGNLCYTAQFNSSRKLLSTEIVLSKTLKIKVMWIWHSVSSELMSKEQKFHFHIKIIAKKPSIHALKTALLVIYFNNFTIFLGETYEIKDPSYC